MIARLFDRLPTSSGMVVVALGDLASIAAFVAIGELSHGNPVLAGAGTFLSFAVGWAIAAILAGAYDRLALSSLTRAVGLAAVAWLGGALLGHLVRLILVPGANFAPTFVLVSLVVGGGFLATWRGFVALVFG